MIPSTSPIKADGSINAQAMPVEGALCPYVSALMAAEVAEVGTLPLAIAPHESLMLSVGLGRDRDCIEQKREHGENTCLTGIRHWTGSFTAPGDCITLFALLTPLGSVRLLESQPLDGVPRIRARVADLLDRKLTRGLESDIALAPTLGDKLRVFAAWLEAHATTNRRLTSAALRAGRAANRVCADPMLPIETLADEQHVSRRQLERDFGRWLGTSPRHLSQVARVQAVSRRAQAGAALADQAHMTRVVRQLTGLTPKAFTRSRQAPMASAYRKATGGRTVYL